MAENRKYDHKYKIQKVKLTKEIGQAKIAKELGISIRFPCARQVMDFTPDYSLVK